jgi:chromosome partitioning protein
MHKEVIMAKVITTTNRKGGCGKSFTVASLGVGLARQGKRVLLIDADNQHSLTVSMGVKEPDGLAVSLMIIISGIVSDKDIASERGYDLARGNNSARDYSLTEGNNSKRDYDPMRGIIEHEEGVHILPANSNLTGIELALATIIGRETILKQHVERVKPCYDYVLIDTCPTLDILAINALAAADSVIIPVTPKYLDAKGLELLLKSIAQIRRAINPKLEIEGILLTMVDGRNNFTKEIIAMIEAAYGGHIRIFKEYIPRSVRAAEASATGKSIFSYNPKGKVAMAYDALAGDVLASGGDCND